MLGAIAMLLPGVWLYIAWAFALPALLVEGLRGPAALRRSYTLVRGRWWRTFSVIALGFLLAIVISTLARGVFLLGLLVADDDALVLVLSTLAGIVGLAVSAPFQAALLTVLYFDTRVRTEDFDLEQLAGEIGAEAPSGTGALPPAVAVGDPPPSGAAGDPLWPSPPRSAGPHDGARSRAAPATRRAAAATGLAAARRRRRPPKTAARPSGPAGRTRGMDLGLQGKACIVTGATRGIGRETARMLRAEGAHVLSVARSGRRGRLPAPTSPNPDDAAAIVAACVERFGDRRRARQQRRHELRALAGGAQRRGLAVAVGAARHGPDAAHARGRAADGRPRRRADRQRLLVGGQAPVADATPPTPSRRRRSCRCRACSPTATRRTPCSSTRSRPAP